MLNKKSGSFLWVLLFLAVCLPLAAAEDDGASSYRSPLNYGFELKYEPSAYSSLVWPNNQYSTASGHSMELAFEWLPFGDAFGKLGIGGAFGSTVISKASYDGGQGKLTTYPLSLFLGYHFDYLPNQVLVPFVRYGFSYVTVHQTPPATGQSESGTYSALNASIGLQFFLNSLEPSAGRYFDASMGINGTYLLAEILWSNSTSSGKHPDLSGRQFRFGIRFEF